MHDIWLSMATEMAKRSRDSGRAKEPKEISFMDNAVKFDVLNFHLVIKLKTGPFVACEALIVDRTAPTFTDILLNIKRKLSLLAQRRNGSDTSYSICRFHSQLRLLKSSII